MQQRIKTFKTLSRAASAATFLSVQIAAIRMAFGAETDLANQ
ncbi:MULTISPECIES: hypothetical protein [unclassified Mesorhizobium]